MELSLPAWLGAFCGMIVAAAIYVPGIRIVERRLRASSGAKTLEQHLRFEQKLSQITTGLGGSRQRCWKPLFCALLRRQPRL